MLLSRKLFKKPYFYLTAILFLVFSCVTEARAALPLHSSFTIGSANYTVDGMNYAMDVSPFIRDGRTYVPVRYIAKAVGVDDKNIIWDGESATLYRNEGDMIISLQPGSTALKKNDIAFEMDVKTLLVNDRLFLPARYIADSFGYDIEYDNITQTISIFNQNGKKISKNVELPRPDLIEGNVEYYELVNLLGLGGANVVEVNDSITINGSLKYEAILLMNGQKRVFVSGKNKEIFVADFNKPVSNIKNIWYVQKDDLVTASMLGTLLSN